MKRKGKERKPPKSFVKDYTILHSHQYVRVAATSNRYHHSIFLGFFCFVLASNSSLLMSQKQKTIFVCYLTWFDFCPCCNPYFEELLPTKFIYLGPIICTSLRFFPPDLCSRLLVTFFHLGCYQGLHSMQGTWPHCLMLWLLLTFLSSDEA